MITHHPEARLWLLRNPGTSYAFQLDADDVPERPQSFGLSAAKHASITNWLPVTGVGRSGSC